MPPYFFVRNSLMRIVFDTFNSLISFQTICNDSFKIDSKCNDKCNDKRIVALKGEYILTGAVDYQLSICEAGETLILHGFSGKIICIDKTFPPNISEIKMNRRRWNGRKNIHSFF